jgi:translation initiation factor IF-2
VGKGKMVNLQKNKKDADRVVKGEECGILYEGDVKIETGDTLVIYTQTQVKGEL